MLRSGSGALTQAISLLTRTLLVLWRVQNMALDFAWVLPKPLAATSLFVDALCRATILFSRKLTNTRPIKSYPQSTDCRAH
ncbi:hypothetical protein GGR50DRAFT_118592 [Xylaria sp. CBS 124048]|nr:hypothetical protein GGR50DRAFT_118592 [Xylaria sp. CBS 124048]